MGGSGPRSKAPFPGPASSTTGRCWAFNRTGFFTRGQQCRYSHRCTWCGGPHHHRACQSKGQQFAKSPPATPLTSYMPSLQPIPTKSELPTPVRVGQLSRYLAGYNAKKARFLLLGFTHGFRLQYHGKREFMDARNLKYAFDLHQALKHEMSLELQSVRVSGPFLLPPFPNLQVSH